MIDEIRRVARGWRWTRRPLVPRSAEAWQRAHEPKEFPTGWARSPAAKAVREAVLRYGFRPLVWTETEPTVEGLDNLDHLLSPVMFVANHASHMDTPLILCSLPKAWRERTAVAAAADYFFDVWWRAASTALVFNTFPIERTGGKRATTTARRLVADGWNLLVYPEGTRSKDGWLGRWRHGAARLCIEYGIPAVPIALRGTYAAMPRGRSWPLKGRLPLSVRFGPALYPQDGEDFRSLSRRMQQAMARLWDEDATNWYQSLRREAEGTTPSLVGPQGPRWRRVWEASRPLPRRSKPKVWKR
ncbi:MAG TPA: lysophospholipid acyltransferase family protein [Actinomycetota bacterium]